jgi:hypothetical protein
MHRASDSISRRGIPVPWSCFFIALPSPACFVLSAIPVWLLYFFFLFAFLFAVSLDFPLLTSSIYSE